MPNSWQFESRPALAFSKIAYQATRLRCDLGDVIRGDGFPKFRYSIPTSQCVCEAQYLCNGWAEFDEKFTPERYNHGDSKNGANGWAEFDEKFTPWRFQKWCQNRCLRPPTQTAFKNPTQSG